MDTIGKKLDYKLKSAFDIFYLDQINQVKIGADLLDHNKLRLYKHLKGTFRVEPYISPFQKNTFLKNELAESLIWSTI